MKCEVANVEDWFGVDFELFHDLLETVTNSYHAHS